MSRRLPHFNRESLEKSLPEAGVKYVWIRELGGRRKKIQGDSPNIALRSPSFRNYADYMLTQEFQMAAGEIASVAESYRVAIMCAERMYFQCHRMLVSDYFTALGHKVLHIIDEKPPREHKMMEEARMVEGKLLYRGDRLL